MIDEEIRTNLRVMSMQGEVIFQDEMSLFYGENTIEIDMQDRSAGVYLVKLDELDGGINHVKKAIKQ